MGHCSLDTNTIVQLGPALIGTWTIALDPTFGSFYLIIFFGESVQIVQIETDCFGVQSVDTLDRCTTTMCNKQ